MDPRRLTHMPTVKAAMTPFPYSVDIDAPVTRAREMMVQHGIRHLPVTEVGALVGVVTEREVAVAERGDGAGRQRVRDVCVRGAYTVELSEALDRVLVRMARDHLGSALVVKRGKLVGIFTVTDACHLLAEFLRARFPDPGDDEAA